MGRLTESILKLVETVAGPLDWKSEYRETGETFSGRFLVYDRRGTIKLGVRGRIVNEMGRVIGVYIFDPPQFVSRHKYGSCLQLLFPNDKWFKLHFERPAANFAEAYTYVEHFLTEAYIQSHSRR